MTWISPNDWWGTADFGTVPDWVVAIGTTAAFLVAAIAFTRDVRDRRAAQARLVYGAISSAEKHVAGSQIYGWGDNAGVRTFEGPDMHSSEDVFGITYLTSDTPRIFATITICNESRELIGPVLVKLDGLGVSMSQMALATALVEPGESADAQILCSWVNSPVAPKPGSCIAFRDSSAQWWTRREGDPIKPASFRERKRFASLARERIARIG